MRMTFFVVWKSWGSNKIRTLLTILGVALGIAVVTAIHVLDHNTIHSRLQQRIADYGRVDLELLPKDPSRSPGHVREQLLPCRTSSPRWGCCTAASWALSRLLRQWPRALRSSTTRREWSCTA